MVTAVIPISIKHRNIAMLAIESIEQQVDYVIAGVDMERKGQAWMLNDLISRVGTEWTLFLDADDLALANRVAVCRPYLEHSDLIYTDYVHSKGIYKSAPMDLERFHDVNFLPFPTVMVKTRIAKEIPFESCYLGSHDWIWLHKVYDKYPRFTHVPVPTIFYNTGTSTYNSKIPVYRKLRRLYVKSINKRKLKEFYKETHGY